MRILVYFAWYDFWVGLYWSKSSRCLYVCLLPMLPIAIQFKLAPREGKP